MIRPRQVPNADKPPETQEATRCPASAREFTRPYKTKYRVTNSAEYNQALVDRGNLTLWHSPQARNRSVKRIAKVGRQRWKTETGYHRQGKVENTFFRYKSMIGDRLRSRDPDSQKTEVILGCNILNRMYEHGRPRSVAIRD